MLTRRDPTSRIPRGRYEARFAHAPKQKYWKVARGILEYLNASSSYGVTFERGSGLNLVFYADATHAPKENKRKYVSGGAVMCGGAAIQRTSRTQKCTTPSSSEAEYVAMAIGFKKAIFLRSVWCFLLPDFGAPRIQVFEDNNGAIRMGVDPVTNYNSKNIDVRHQSLSGREILVPLMCSRNSSSLIS